LFSRYYKKAADGGYRAAIFALGECYENGIGVEKNQNLAKQYFTNAANQGYKRNKWDFLPWQEPPKEDQEQNQ
jgi:TPR repeat protein